MKTKPLILVLAALAGVGGMWFGWSAARDRWHSATPPADTVNGSDSPGHAPAPPNTLRPPNPNRRFEKLSPEERVRLARKGPVGG